MEELEYEFLEELEMGLSPEEFLEYKRKEAKRLNFAKDWDPETLNDTLQDMFETYEYEYVKYRQETKLPIKSW